MQSASLNVTVLVFFPFECRGGEGEGRGRGGGREAAVVEFSKSELPSRGSRAEQELIHLLRPPPPFRDGKNLFVPTW